MSTASLFQKFLKNISVKNSNEISFHYKKITKALNWYYYNLDNDSKNCRQIGSYGRNTGINGISDLDMAFELPETIYSKFNAYSSLQQTSLLQDVKKAIQTTYHVDQVKADGQIVSVNIEGFKIEVLPTFFLNKDFQGNLDKEIYTFPDSGDGGRWRETKPKKEIQATRNLNDEYGHNTYRHLCRMVRAWKNNVGAKFSGLWIDTLVYNFLISKIEYKNISYKEYGKLVKDFFRYLFDQYEKYPEQQRWHAPGSRQVVHGSWTHHKKIKKAYRLCLEAIEDEKNANENWSKVFGINFPEEEDQQLHESFIINKKAPKEQFVEYAYNGRVDIKNSVSIDYTISSETKTWRFLKKALPAYKVPVSRKLEFFIRSIDVETPYEVKWKVRNIGMVARTKNEERGQLQYSTFGKYQTSKLIENTNFAGEHWVECYIIKNGICVARDHVSVPI